MKKEELFKSKNTYEKIKRASSTGAQFTGRGSNIVIRKKCKKEKADLSFYGLKKDGSLDVFHAIAKDEGRQQWHPKNNIYWYAENSKYSHCFITYHLKGQTVKRQTFFNLNKHKLSSSGKEVLIYESKNLESVLCEPFETEEDAKSEAQYKNTLKRRKKGLEERGITQAIVANWAINACGETLETKDPVELYENYITAIAMGANDADYIGKKIAKISTTFERFKNKFNNNYLDFCAWYLKHEATCALCKKTEVVLQQEYEHWFKSKPTDLKTSYYDSLKQKPDIVLGVTRKNYHEEYSFDNAMLTCRECKNKLYETQNPHNEMPHYLKTKKVVPKKKLHEDSSKNLQENLEKRGVTKDIVLNWAKLHCENDLHIENSDDFYNKILGMLATYSETYPSQVISSYKKNSLFAQKIRNIVRYKKDVSTMKEEDFLAWALTQELKCYFCGITEDQIEANFFTPENFNPKKNVKKEIRLTVTQKELYGNNAIDNYIFACPSCAKNHKKKQDALWHQHHEKKRALLKEKAY